MSNNLCVSCGAHKGLSRGLCFDKCYPLFFQLVKRGWTTWERLEKEGRSLAPKMPHKRLIELERRVKELEALLCQKSESV
jgi:hypothetical protein